MKRALLALVLLACASAPPAPGGERGVAPRPFTAAQIRAAMPVGTEITFRRVAKGEPATFIVWKVTAADETQMTMHTRIVDEGDKVLREEDATATWDELMKHATFPLARTEISVGSVDVPAGHFATLDYLVKTDDGTEAFHFAKDLPGPPVAVIREKGGAVVEEMLLTSRK